MSSEPLNLENLPAPVRQRALAAGDHAWLEDLPALVRQLEREWEMVVGTVFSGGSEAFVAEATVADGTPAILKLLLPSSANTARTEIITLRLADGDGCARLFRSDLGRHALLLERLGRTLADVEPDAARRRDILCAIAERIWRPAAGAGLPTGAEKGRWLGEFIPVQWEALGRPCSERAVEYALAAGRKRIAAHDDERAVLVHGDIHAWNALEAAQGFKLIDPDGLLAEAEYDLGVVIRGEPLRPHDPNMKAEAELVARRAGRDAAATWEWAAVERVSSGLTCLLVGLEAEGRQMLASAEAAAEG